MAFVVPVILAGVPLGYYTWTTVYRAIDEQAVRILSRGEFKNVSIMVVNSFLENFEMQCNIPFLKKNLPNELHLL